MNTLNYKVAEIEDLVDIVRIYNSTISSRMVTADTDPVTVESRINWFNEHDAIKRPLFMIYDDNKIVGWVSFQSFYGRPAYDGTAELSIYLDENQRGRGLGKRVLQHCITIAPIYQIKTILAFIFAHNVPSLHLFKNFNFEEWAFLPNIAELDGTERSLCILGRRI